MGSSIPDTSQQEASPPGTTVNSVCAAFGPLNKQNLRERYDELVNDGKLLPAMGDENEDLLWPKVEAASAEVLEKLVTVRFDDMHSPFVALPRDEVLVPAALKDVLSTDEGMSSWQKFGIKIAKELTPFIERGIEEGPAQKMNSVQLTQLIFNVACQSYLAENKIDVRLTGGRVSPGGINSFRE